MAKRRLDAGQAGLGQGRPPRARRGQFLPESEFACWLTGEQKQFRLLALRVCAGPGKGDKARGNKSQEEFVAW